VRQRSLSRSLSAADFCADAEAGKQPRGVPGLALRSSGADHGSSDEDPEPEDLSWPAAGTRGASVSAAHPTAARPPTK
jgi:hypothetical protein